MKQDMKTLIEDLSVAEKIELLECLYHELSGHGTDGDTELAHINTREASILKALGGSGTINEVTGLRQYGKGGSPPPPPSSQTVQQEIPDELKPYISDILAKSQAIQEQRMDEGYRPYTGPQLASFSPQQMQAFQGVSGLQGLTGQYMAPAAGLTAASAMMPTSQEVGMYMNPYMQNVVDIQQREAQRQADVAGQEQAKQAVAAGSFGGSRDAIVRAEAARNLQTQLGDIQYKGLAAAYEDAQARLAAQRQREMAAGQQFGQLGQTALSGNLQELSALQQAGLTQQTQQQAALDIARQQFEAEKTFPEQTLQQYSSIIRGYAAPIGGSYTSTATTPAPSYLQQLAGLGTTAYGLSKSGLFKEGGKVGDGRGIASIVVKRKKGGKVIKMQLGGRVPSYIVPNDPRKLYEIINTSDDPELKDAAIARIRELESSSGGEQNREDLERGSFMKPGVLNPFNQYDRASKFREKSMGPNRTSPFSVGPKSPSEYYMEYLGKPFAAAAKRQEENVAKEMAGVPTEHMSNKNLENQLSNFSTDDIISALGSYSGTGYDTDSRDALINELKRRNTDTTPVDPSSKTAVSVNLNSVGVSPAITSADAQRRVAEIEANQQRQNSKDASRGVTVNLGDSAGTTQDNKVGISDPNLLVAEQAGLVDAEDAAQKTVSNMATTANSMNPFNTEGINAFYSEAIDKFNALGEKQKAALASGEKDLESQKWMAVAELGMSILAQPGGQTFLQAIGKGAKDADTFKTLSKLSDKKRQLALDLVNLDEKTLSREYGINKDAAAAVRADATLGLKYKELVIKRASAKTDAEKAAYDIAIRQAEQARKTFESGKAPKLARGQSDPLDSVADEVLKREGYKTGWLGGIDTSLKEVFKETYRQAFSQTRGNRQAAENAAINAVRKFRPTN